MKNRKVGSEIQIIWGRDPRSTAENDGKTNYN